MRLIIYSVLAVMLFGTVASADRDRRGDRRDDRRDRVRDNRRDSRPVVRDNRRHDRPVVRDNRVRRDRFRGNVRANRRLVNRHNHLRHNNGRFTFHNGRTYVYTRPVIRNRYYDVRIRPQIIVENHPAQYGYIWVNGNWSWSGAEWQWNDGHYAPDPSFSEYYDDDSYEVHVDYRSDGY